MRWYVLKTWAGREEELAGLIRRVIPPQLYEDCFVILHERLWRRERRNILHKEVLFPGLVFLTCREPEPLFRYLEQVPVVSRLLADGEFSILPMDGEEAALLEKLQDQDHVVKLSYVSTDGMGHVFRVEGPLSSCEEKVERYGFKKRFAIIRLKLLGEETTAALGICLNEDAEEMQGFLRAMG